MTLRRRIRFGLLGMAAIIGATLIVDQRHVRDERESAASLKAIAQSIARVNDARVHVARAPGALGPAQAGDEQEQRDLLASLTAMESWRRWAAATGEAEESSRLVERFLKIATGVPQAGVALEEQAHRAAADALASLQRDRGVLLARVEDQVSRRESAQISSALVHLLRDLGMILVVAFLGWTLAKSVLGPLDTLRRHMVRVEAGIPDESLPVRRNDEIGAIFASFNRLSESLRLRLRDLELRARRIDGLASIVQSASWGKESTSFLHEALSRTVRLVENDLGMIRLLNPRTGRLKLAATEGLDAVLDLLEPEIEAGRYASGQSFQTGQTVVADDALADPRMAPQEIVRKEHVVSVASVPLVSRGRCLGSLSVGMHKHHHYTLEEITLLETAGRIVGAAVDNGRLVQESAAQLRDLSTLLDLARAVNAAPDLDRLAVIYLEILARATGADCGVLLLREAASGDLVSRGSIGEQREWLNWLSWSESENSVVWQVFRDRRPVLIPGDGEGRKIPSVLAEQIGMRSCLIVPVVHEHVSRGILILGSTRPQAPLDPGLVPLVTSAADQLGPAIQTAREPERRRIPSRVDIDAAMVPRADPVTGLPNLAAFRDLAARQIERACERRSILAVASLASQEAVCAGADARHDEAVRADARRLRAALRETDLVGCSPDGSFLALLPGANRDVVRDLAARLDIASGVAGRPRHFRIGVALYPEDGQDLELLIDAARRERESSVETGTDAEVGTRDERLAA